MRIAKGFKCRYFSLAAITATSANATLHAINTAFSSFFILKSPKEEKDEEANESPPELIETELQQKPCYRLWVKKPFHCNCLFKRNTRLTLLYSKLKKKPPCRCRFRKTGLAPPLSLLLN